MKSQKKAFQNIIVGVDFSQYSRLAVEQAKLLAKNFNAKLTLAYARGPWLFVDDGSTYGFKDRAIFETAEMEQLMRKFYKIEKRSKHRILVRSGSPAEVLNKLGSSVSKPLIVIGSQGSGAIGRFLLGSNAEKVALTSPFPVWIHKGPKTVTAQKVLVPMDLSNKNQKAMEFLNQWFDRKKTSLQYLFVRPFSPIGWQTRAYEVFYNLEQRNEQLLKKFQQSHPEAEVYVSAGDPAQQIHRTLSEYDLIVMTPHNKYGDSQLFGKVTTKIIRLAQKPILIVKATKTVSMQKEKTEKEGARQSEPSLQLHS